MNMENKYFTPSIGDIRVGYELEHKFPDGWKKVTVGITGRLEAWDDYLQEDRIRVPYLTKEQIEAEGWTFRNTNKIRYWYYLDDTFFECPMTVGYQMMKLTMMHDPEYQAITIRAYFRGEAGYKDDEAELPIIYQGFCKDINTFRYIMKLLNIK